MATLYYGPPIRKVSTENHIHRPVELVPLPHAPTRAEAEITWHLRMPRPPVHSQTQFFPYVACTRVEVRSGRMVDDRRAHGVALSLARAGHGIRDEGARVLDAMPDTRERKKLELYCQFPGVNQPIMQPEPSPIAAVHSNGALYTLGELVSVVATMYERFVRSGVALPQNGAIPRANGMPFQFEQVRLVALHFGRGQYAGLIVPEVILVDRDPQP